MENNCIQLINQSLDVINQLKDITVELGQTDINTEKKNFKKIRKSKLLLLQLKESSRKVFGTLQNTSNRIDEEMAKSDKILSEVRRIESEIGRVRNRITYYKSFSMPQYDSVISAVDDKPFDETNTDSSSFTQRTEFLKDELNSRKRLKEELDEKIRSKEQCLKASMQLKHQFHNVVVQKINNIEEAIKKANDSYAELLDKEDLDENTEVSPTETSEPPDETPTEEMTK